ncbi:MAG: prolipoprotein diacylglyceryl transferase [candidate division Zixibacteria bacterium]|nr:prolipoprotein diacylglyceryl transferase [candidate division Zixibacteria bacterium]MBU1469668.1 prolipoprotein diacylglyceryl transferase [candidate division Zixibacteria bacterium]MBU2624737.1 prolipoprotein diacylglyceryl transferase [candidate division Zixibacteria bacterium]
MFPEVITLGPVIIRSYGVMLALSFMLGVLLVRHRSRRSGVNPDFAVNLAFLVIISAVIGARMFYAFFHWSDFSGHLIDIFNPLGSSEGFGIAGLNLYGGLITALSAAVVFCYLKKESILVVFDLFAPAIALGIFLTRIGCFLNGCCFGTECHLPWGVNFPVGSIPYSYLGDVPLHPAQLYSSLYGLLLFVALSISEKRKPFVGLTFSLFLMTEAMFRFLIEYVRFYENQMLTTVFGIGFTYNHIMAMFLFLIGLMLLLVSRKRGVKPARARKSGRLKTGD